MISKRTNMIARCGLAFALSAALVASGAAAPPKSARAKRQARMASKDSPLLITNQSTTQNTDSFSGTELWFFGMSDIKRMKPFNAQGTRTIVDLRTLNTKGAIAFLDKMSKSGKGAAICLRWKNPDHQGDRPMGEDNYDVAPTAEETAQALSAISEVLSSAPAKKMGKRLYVEIYNEIGGGPGRFGIDDVEGMFAFADAVVPVIREANPDVRICGPALSGGQLNEYGNEPRTPGKILKSELIERWMQWTARNADVTDVHLNGVNVDSQWADNALTNMRQILDERGGQNVGLVSFEWSCSGYPDSTDDAGITNYIQSLWDTLKSHQVQVAAYTYWPLFDRPDEIRDKSSWATVVGVDKKPNRPVADALTEIGKTQ